MAHVLKLSRGHAMPPTFTSANEWFNYAFSTSEVKGNMLLIWRDTPGLSVLQLVLTLYHTVQTFNNLEKEAF